MKLVYIFKLQGSTICMHDFGHVDVDMYAHFFPYDFWKFPEFFWFL